MRSRSLVTTLLLAIAITMTGCTGNQGTSARRPIGSDPTPVFLPPQPAKDSSQPQDLTAALTALPSATDQPVYRWPQVPDGMEYRPLPSGVLLSWTEVLIKREGSKPVVISAQGPGGKPLWSRQLDALVQDVKRIDVPPSGESVVITRRNGEVLVLSTSDGQTTATFRIALNNPDSDSVDLIANGRYLAVKSRNKSGIVPWDVTAYSVKPGGNVVYRNNGMAVHLSPYHDLVLGLEALEGKFIRAVDPSGPVGNIPYDYQVQQQRVELASSADGQLIYVWSANKGLDVYSREAQRLLNIPAADFRDVDVAPVSKAIWHQVAPGSLEVIDASGKKTAFTYDNQKITPGRVMPGGERVFEVKTGTQKAECVVRQNRQVVGCYPFVDFATATVGGKTLFWTELQDGTVAAY